MKKLLALAAVMLATVFVSRVSATVVFSDDFDSYANQAAFVAAWPAAVGAGHTLSTAQSVSGAQSINLLTTAQRNDRGFSETGVPSATNGIRFSFDFYDSAAANFPYRQIVTLIDGAGSSNGQLISIGMNNNQSTTDSGGNRYMTRILGFTPIAPYVDPDGGPNEGGTLATGSPLSSPFVKLNDFANAPLRSTGWHNLALEITLNPSVSTSQDFTFYTDGVKSEVITLAGFTLRSYDRIRIGSGITSTTAAYVDNILVETFNPAAVPEASAFLAVGLVGLVFGGVRCTRHRRTAA
jgi:hypothetical protein